MDPPRAFKCIPSKICPKWKGSCQLYRRTKAVSVLIHTIGTNKRGLAHPLLPRTPFFASMYPLWGSTNTTYQDTKSLSVRYQPSRLILMCAPRFLSISYWENSPVMASLEGVWRINVIKCGIGLTTTSSESKFLLDRLEGIGFPHRALLGRTIPLLRAHSIDRLQGSFVVRPGKSSTD